MDDTRTVDVAIIGAGAAGLAAARVLRDTGVEIAVLEARGRAGGRVYTYRDPRVPVPIELGAEFLHGDTPETNAILREAHLAAYEVMGEHWRAEAGAFSKADDFWKGVGRVFRKIQDPDGEDRSFLDALISLPPDKPKRMRDRQFAREFVEGFYAADASRISVRSLADVGSDSDSLSRSGRVPAGYDRVIATLAQQVYDAISLNTVVDRITWSPGHVEIDARSGPDGMATRVIARHAIITVPLGVLQRPDGDEGAIAFSPPLPDTHKQALDKLGMGTVIRVVLAFREPFWESLPNPPKKSEAHELSFLHGAGSDVPVWWTLFPMRTGVMVGWAGGPLAAALARNDDDEIITRALAALSRHVGRQVDELRELLDGAWTHNWERDPFARGAYSYPLVDGSEAGTTLAEPIDGTLFVTGEATITGGASGTVEGALVSGQRAAQAVLEALI